MVSAFEICALQIKSTVHFTLAVNCIQIKENQITPTVTVGNQSERQLSSVRSSLK